MKKLLYLILFSFPIWLFAQQTRVDAIYLKNGSIFKGKIIAIAPDKSIQLQILEDTLKINIPENTIKKIVQEYPNSGSIQTIKPYAFQEKGLYNTLYVGINPGYFKENQWNKSYYIGFNGSFSMGYQFNRFYGIGMGVGFENFYYDHVNIPLFLETKGYWRKKKISPYHSISIGYNIATAADPKSTKGGLFFHPCIGFRIGANSEINYLFDIGLRLQNITRNYEITQWDNSVLKYSETWFYKRISFRFGIIF